MELNKRLWPLSTVFGIRERIDTNPDYQRPPVWSLAQKRLLIDTVLRGYDIPKMYWRKVSAGPDRYEVVDGQQRLRAIWEYMNGEFDLGRDAEPVGGVDVRGIRYSSSNGDQSLPDDLRLNFDTYTLDVIILSETDEEEVREMFLRLQNGTSLKAQEKRNALTGNMRDFVKQTACHPFFTSCKFDNSRYTYDLIAAQMIKLELEGGPGNVKNADLNRMYKSEKQFDVGGSKAKKVRKVLDFMHRAFPHKTPELERYSAVSIYLMVSHLMEKYVYSSLASDIHDWFIGFEQYRRAQKELGVDDCDPEILSYHDRTSHSTDSEDSLAWRNEYLLRKYFEHNDRVELKDNNRAFSHEQRVTIYRRDKGICQLRIGCQGKKCEWDNWEADHQIAWSNGGKTTVENGQVACSECNSSKGGS
jgi:5-methylcytosine-specific restriction endonuclease McrA